MSRYIGARYAPLFDGQHDSTKAYEPLTVVISEGNSYCSKKYVPAGIAVSNGEYWVLVGNFNQQVANLQEYVQEHDEQIQQLETDVGTLIDDVDVARSALRNLASYFYTRRLEIVIPATEPGAMASATGTITLPENFALLNVGGVETSGPFAINSYFASEVTATRVVTGTAKVYNMGQNTTGGSVVLDLLCYNKEGL